MSRTCDTSVLVPVLAAWHPAHDAARAAWHKARLEAIPAHVLLETYSVLTRAPHDRQVAPPIASDAIDALTVTALTLPADEHRAVIRTLAARGIGGGAIYDALIAATARHHRLSLITRDVRAARTYEAIGVAFEFV